jgi:hypothetical protein
LVGSRAVEIESIPEQPPAVTAALEALLAETVKVDPWWQAGLAEALES